MCSLTSQRCGVILCCVPLPRYREGDFIIKQGDAGDAFFVIKSGTVACTVDGVGEVASLGPGDFFGEMALLNDAPRTANVIARGAVSALSLGRGPFELMLGPLQVRLPLCVGGLLLDLMVPSGTAAGDDGRHRVETPKRN